MALPPKRELGTPDAPPAPPTGSEYSVEFVDLAQGIKNLRQAFLNRERFPMSHKQAADLAATSEALLGRLRQDMGNDKGYQRAKTDPANASDAERRRAMVMDRLVAQTQEVSNRAINLGLSSGDAFLNCSTLLMIPGSITISPTVLTDIL